MLLTQGLKDNARTDNRCSLTVMRCSSSSSRGTKRSHINSFSPLTIRKHGRAGSAEQRDGAMEAFDSAWFYLMIANAGAEPR
jgi:hypothetical protein